MDLPQWFYLVWTTIVQFSPIKEKGPTPSQDEVRPVGCGGMVRRAISAMVKVVKKATLQQICEPIKLGQGTPGVTQAIGIGIQIHMETFPDHIAVSDDTRNAFNEIELAAIVEHC
jgi:hypothetical protein